jgi:DNA polymerase
LGLGYGTGKKKLRHTLKTQPPGADLPEEECGRIVSLYRNLNFRVVELWKQGDQVLQDLMSWPSGKPAYWYGREGVVLVTQQGLMLPNSLLITYKNLRMEDGKVVHDARDGTKSIWGGVVVENVIQALARIVVGEQMCALPDWLRPILTVHDAAVVLSHKSMIDEAVATITKVMSTPPRWGKTLPVACEAKYGESYGDC